MRRAPGILRYLPAALCGLLVVAWTISTVYSLRLLFWRFQFGLADGNVTVQYFRYVDELFVQYEIYPNRANVVYLGWFRFFDSDDLVLIPICWMLTILLPFAIICSNGYRFPLWFFFAWTALISAELAYYLR